MRDEKEKRASGEGPMPFHRLKKRAEALQAIIGRAVIDPEFRKELSAKPDQVAQQFALDEVGAQALRQIDIKDIESLASSLRSKLSKEPAVVIFCG